MEIGGLTNILKFFNLFLFISNIEKKIEKNMKEKTCILRIQVLFTINETSKSHTHIYIYICVCVCVCVCFNWLRFIRTHIT